VDPMDKALVHVMMVVVELELVCLGFDAADVAAGGAFGGAIAPQKVKNLH